MYLLDTCTVSDYVKVYSERLNTTLMNHEPGHIFLSAITIEEIEFGFHKNAPAKKNWANVYSFFLKPLRPATFYQLMQLLRSLQVKSELTYKITGK